jgi:Histidine kinase-, DNA gyrase B-, and HSP90-like ATPase
VEDKVAKSDPKYVAEQLSLFSDQEGNAGEVQLSHELVGLLSDQLYKSPVKAIEELVVNAYDADASECRLHVPSPAKITDPDAYIAVFDNGIGMDKQGLLDLWHIGHSRKRDSDVVARLQRRSIGKFGIGKLATYSVGKRLTYISKTADVSGNASPILGVTVDFTAFDTGSKGQSVKVPLPVWKLGKWSDFQKSAVLKSVIESLDLDSAAFKKEHWTLALVEDLKPKAVDIKLGMLKWVLSTAMPLGTDFHVYLNKSEVKSSKERATKLVDFQLSELPQKRLNQLKDATGVEWKIEDDKLVTTDFPSGITGRVFVTEKSLYGAKSDDIARSHGFFVKVRGRLINQLDPYFGVFPKSYEVWNSFRADINADDLDELVMSSREDLEASQKKKHVESLLGELFNEARTQYQKVKDAQEDQQRTKKEDEREFVAPRLVEEPLADALLQGSADASDGWFYLAVDKTTDVSILVDRLYNQPRTKYSFSYEKLGRNGRLFRYEPADGRFVINDDHEFVQEHAEDARERGLLEDIVTAEVMLEANLRRSGVRTSVVTDVLNNRDTLLRSLSKERRFSLVAMASSLRDASGDEHDLEVALVYCARALGFAAKHISGAGEPDGLGTFVDYPLGERTIILEAKSSATVPSLSAIDFAGLHSHMVRYKATGCLLIAPDYPGKTVEDNEAAARAENLKISCWTVDQLASVVENVEKRHITANAILEVVTTCFKPASVTARIKALLVEPTWKHQDLYRAIVAALRDLEGTGADAVRDVSMVLGVLAGRPEFKGIKKKDVEDSVLQLSSSSKGAITFRAEQGKIIVHTGWDELERRVAALTGVSGVPRKGGPFRK